ncbi:MAG TPA: ATP-binding protein [Candidatus Fermentibacter daniensis]|nr:ATP-binding protein [Candidatus Fermentibacter daniensis]HOR07834.1 ATP-binding protein [Candidatus Fermentibacter daniensis]HOZ18704.1 ATP-binding protein [Candidatus Fermentibacter daniensis]HPH40634.1 ATP-binding protein [Candidatus Fermentibacter daniensis]HPK52737.1 ATP-binding protein [Candidatus Fermentibacter daniensis]
MTGSHDPEYLSGLVQELVKLPSETEWAEFKLNNDDPHEIGEYISALSNSAALNDKAFAYLLWGIEDATHEIIGTTFEPSLTRKGNEPLETWLLRLLSPRIDFKFHEVTIDGCKIVLLKIDRASRHPVAFNRTEYLRVGECKRKLVDFPEKERALWRILNQVRFEDIVAAERQSPDQILSKLECPAYFDLLEIPLPDGHSAILDALEKDRLIAPCEAGGFNITNLGAILFARRLSDFPSLRRKAVRVIQYRGAGRTETIREQESDRGYACGFEGLIDSVNGLLPTKEVIDAALRRVVPVFPEPAVRELVANALIHQDFHVSGAGPMVEIFDDRIEITNPGEPLVDTRRFIDTPPRSRNETLASMMRRFRICEERGSGIDKVISQIEYYQLPAPLFEVPAGFTRAVLFAHRPISRMDKVDRIRACYLHACLKHVMREHLTNASLRLRFGVEERNKAAISRYIREAVTAGAIKPFDEHAGRKMMKYVPFWA